MATRETTGLLPMNLSFAKCRLRLREAPFPLTPTLSPRERENRFLIWSAKRFWFVRRRAAHFPLPKGEGQGEGEQDVSQPDAPNAPPKMKGSKREISIRGILSSRTRAGVRGNRSPVTALFSKSARQVVSGLLLCCALHLHAQLG